jgi:carbamoyl-phosphate synthase large subunit
MPSSPGSPSSEIFDLTKIDPWFLHQLREIYEMERELACTPSLRPPPPVIPGPSTPVPLLRRAKQFGFSDAQLAHILKHRFRDGRARRRKKLGVATTYRLVDTCAAEFEAFTPYYYSSYGDENEVLPPKGKKKIMILGGGPNRIGQGIEFDYCCVHASFALREIGFESVMVNSNPETVSTDYDTSDRLYFEPLTLEDVLEIYQQEGCDGAIVQFGGQTPLNLATALKANGVNIIGTSPESIETAEDRKLFANMLDKVGLRQPANRTAMNEAEALTFAREIGFPCCSARPSCSAAAACSSSTARRSSRRRPPGVRRHAGQARADRQVPRGRHRARCRLHQRRRDQSSSAACSSTSSSPACIPVTPPW